jgi:hypothetical protein
MPVSYVEEVVEVMQVAAGYRKLPYEMMYRM